jgi:hypothetical protein
MAEYNDYYWQLRSFGLSHEVALNTAYPQGYWDPGSMNDPDPEPVKSTDPVYTTDPQPAPTSTTTYAEGVSPDDAYVPYQSSIDLYNEQQINAIVTPSDADTAYFEQKAIDEADLIATDDPTTPGYDAPVTSVESVTDDSGGSGGTSGTSGTSGTGGTTSTSTTGGTTGGATAPAPQPPTAPAGVMPGGELVRVLRNDGTEFWVQSYFRDGRYYTWTYDSWEQVEQMLGANPDQTTRDEDWWRGVINAGMASEIVGMDRSFGNFMDEIIYEAALSAGINDPSMVGRMVNDPEMMNILIESSLEDWTEEQLLAAQRNTTFWTEVLYPGIDNLYSVSANPEADYLEYERSVRNSLGQMGYISDNGSYRNIVGDMLDSGVDAQTFIALTPTYIKAAQSQDYMDAFSAWTGEEFGQSIGFDEWFDLLGGMAQPDLLAAAERATISYVAQQTGSLANDDQIIRLAAETELSEDQVRSMFADIDQALTAIAGGGYEKYGLTQDDIFSLKGGISPLSGRTLEDIRVKTAQAARELGLLDEEKIKLYTAYDPEEGSPFRPGLFGLAPRT